MAAPSSAAAAAMTEDMVDGQRAADKAEAATAGVAEEEDDAPEDEGDEDEEDEEEEDEEEDDDEDDDDEEDDDDDDDDDGNVDGICTICGSGNGLVSAQRSSNVNCCVHCYHRFVGEREARKVYPRRAEVAKFAPHQQEGLCVDTPEQFMFCSARCPRCRDRFWERALAAGLNVDPDAEVKRSIVIEDPISGRSPNPITDPELLKRCIVCGRDEHTARKFCRSYLPNCLDCGFGGNCPCFGRVCGRCANTFVMAARLAKENKPWPARTTRYQCQRPDDTVDVYTQLCRSDCITCRRRRYDRSLHIGMLPELVDKPRGRKRRSSAGPQRNDAQDNDHPGYRDMREDSTFQNALLRVLPMLVAGQVPSKVTLAEAAARLDEAANSPRTVAEVLADPRMEIFAPKPAQRVEETLALARKAAAEAREQREQREQIEQREREQREQHMLEAIEQERLESAESSQRKRKRSMTDDGDDDDDGDEDEDETGTAGGDVHPSQPSAAASSPAAAAAEVGQPRSCHICGRMSNFISRERAGGIDACADCFRRYVAEREARRHYPSRSFVADFAPHLQDGLSVDSAEQFVFCNARCPRCRGRFYERCLEKKMAPAEDEPVRSSLIVQEDVHAMPPFPITTMEELMRCNVCGKPESLLSKHSRSYFPACDACGFGGSCPCFGRVCSRCAGAFVQGIRMQKEGKTWTQRHSSYRCRNPDASIDQPVEACRGDCADCRRRRFQRSLRIGMTGDLVDRKSISKYNKKKSKKDDASEKDDEGSQRDDASTRDDAAGDVDGAAASAAATPTA